ncbi:dnaJ homolog subfamily C member 3-like, partial [Daktulosphaira vitifoliae]|uniref:dnaJ homolog subfamily C member 3-like n=1 Tax=Daktulosphaira vitifoliae TaxID=58002 RepID=UPI0021AA6A3E
FLARGQLQDALSHYHAAVEGDPGNYLTYFKRGTVYLALGKAKFALLDFGKVLDLKPDFTSARFQRGVVYMKQASFEEAKKDLYNVYINNGDFSAEANELYSKLDGLAYDVDLGLYYQDQNDHASAVQIYDRLIEHCPWAPSLRENRSQSHLKIGNIQHAIMDLRTATKLQSDDTDGYYKLSKLHYSIGQVSESLREIRECLKLDPDHKLCHSHYKQVKKVDKLLIDSQSAFNIKDYSSCITFSKKV